MFKELTRVSEAKLCFEHEILTLFICVAYESGVKSFNVKFFVPLVASGSQAVGGYSLDSYDKETHTRVGTAYGCEFIRRILQLFRVNDLSEIKGKYVYVLTEKEGLNGDILGLQTLKLDGEVKTFLFNDLFKEFYE